MIRFARVAVVSVLVIAAAACGVGQQGPSQEEGGGGGGPNKICMMPKLVGIPYFNASEQGARRRPESLASIWCTTVPPRPKPRCSRR